MRQEGLTQVGGWELLIIDNASDPPLNTLIDISSMPNARIIREEKLGLTHARLRSFFEARGEILVYIDDDNILSPNYLLATLNAFDSDSRLGATGGKSIPRWETSPPEWFFRTGISLACRDLGNQRLSASWDDEDGSERTYPKCAPIGAGMGVRKAAYGSYVQKAVDDPLRKSLGRKGTDLASGEDNDMVLSILADGWRVAYLPELYLDHIIPSGRLSLDYLERYARSSCRTWVQVLAVHGIFPWTPIAPWTVPIRKARAWFRERPWMGPVNRTKWQAACGTFEGRAIIQGLRLSK